MNTSRPALSGPIRWAHPTKGRRKTANGTPDTRWGVAYRERMNTGREVCRNCGTSQTDRNPLTFDHVIPIAVTGRATLAFTNATILCGRCNQAKGDRVWRALRSLAQEEADAPPERRWSKLSGSRGKDQAHPDRVEMTHRVLRVLVALYPEPIEHWDLAVEMGYERVGSDSRTVLAALRLLLRRKLVTCVDQRWVATQAALDGAGFEVAR